MRLSFELLVAVQNRKRAIFSPQFLPILSWFLDLTCFRDSGVTCARTFFSPPLTQPPPPPPPNSKIVSTPLNNTASLSSPTPKPSPVKYCPTQLFSKMSEKVNHRGRPLLSTKGGFESSTPDSCRSSSHVCSLAESMG